MQISPHFSLDELTFSQVALRKGLDNTPAAFDIANLTRLCEMLLEPARLILGVPLHVDSGYRSPAVNHAVGGAENSAHMVGRAADVIPIGMPVEVAFDKLRTNGLPYDKILYECRSWIHLQVPVGGRDPLREAYLASGYPGNWHYEVAPPLVA
jgi:zinc D-Ala-D-Ala carboxypeptidase